MYDYTNDKYIFLENQKNKFIKLLNNDKKEKIHYILNLDSCHNINEFFKQIKKDYKFPDYFGKNLDAIADCLLNYAYDGKVAFLEVANWLKFSKLENGMFYNFLDILFIRAQEARRLENINYYIYLDEMPDFSNPLISVYKQNIIN